MPYVFPFGKELRPLVQEDRTPKKIFILGVYASAVHARWQKDGKVICQALAVASEPRIFWDGNTEEAKAIIESIPLPESLGTLTPAGKQLNGPSAKVLDEQILAPLGFTRKDTWLCDLLPETRLNSSQVKALKEKYEPLMDAYGLPAVTIPKRPQRFCDQQRCAEITAEVIESNAETLVLLGDIPISQYLNRVADVDFTTLSEYTARYGYGMKAEAVIGGKKINILPLAHPRQIGALGAHSEKWCEMHRNWIENLKSKGI